MIRLGDEDANDLIAQIHVALDRRNGSAGAFVITKDKESAFLPADFVRQFALVPFFEDEDFAFVAFDDAADDFQRAVQVRCESGAQKEHRLVLIDGDDRFFCLSHWTIPLR